MRVAVIGAKGLVGSDMCEAFEKAGNEVIRLDHDLIEVTDRESVKYALSGKPDIIINTACLHTVACENDPAKAYLINAIGARNIAETANAQGALLIHISTDQVFDGKSDIAYVEMDKPSPVMVYASTKLAGELFVKHACPRHQILRTTALFGKNPTRGKPGGLNFVDLMLKLAKENGLVRVVNDEFTTPTSTISLAKQALILSAHQFPAVEYHGVFHAVGTGSCSWYEFAQEVFAQTHTPVTLQVSPPNFSGFERPKHLTMVNKRLNDLGLNIFKPWREELRGYLEERKCRQAQ
jgi:dTDP-4-dehydrorhamnose reductase